MQVQSDIGQVRKWHSYKVIALKVGRTKVLYTNNQRDKKKKKKNLPELL